MRDIGKNFSKKIAAIILVEDINMAQFARITGVDYQRVHHYFTFPNAKPSINNVGMVLDAFPQYTCYILDLDPKYLTKQIILKD